MGKSVSQDKQSRFATELVLMKLVGGLGLSSLRWSFFDFLVSNPDLNHMRFYWDQSIDFEFVNPECNASWSYPIEAMQSTPLNKTIKSQIRDVYLTARRWLYSQNSRNKKINVYDLLMFPNCTSSSLHITENNVLCNNCVSSYLINNRIPRIFPKNISGLNNTPGIELIEKNE